IYWNRLGTFYYQQGNYDKALEYYSTTIQKKPDDPIGFENIGLTYEKMQKPAEAEKAFQKAIEVATKDRDIYFNRLGVFYYRQIRDEDAIQFYKKAIELQPKAVYYENIGLAYESLKK